MPRLLLLGCCLLFNAPLTGWCERVLLDEAWRFHLGDTEGAEAADYEDTDWTLVDLPHDWSIGSVPEPNAPSRGAGGYHEMGVGWYRQTLPARPPGERWRIEFDGAYRRTTVWLNGVELGTKAYGYTPFSFDLTPQASTDHPNLISVRVDNSDQPNCRWYSGSGLYRPVWLRSSGDLAIEPDSVWMRTDKLTPEAEVSIALAVVNRKGDEAIGSIRVALVEPEKRVVAKTSMELSLLPSESKAYEIALEVPNTRPWSPSSPSLYELRVELVSASGDLVDSVAQRVGLRTISFDSDRGMLLNGDPIELFGGNVHHDHGPLGAASYDLAEQRRVRLLKEAGFNAVRTAHNPPSEAFLDACDKQGLLVIDEAFDGWRKNKLPHDYGEVFEANWREDLTAMVRRDRRHPSVVMWSIGNEMYERGGKSGVQLAQELSTLVKRLDKSRPVTAGVNGLGKKAWSGLDPLFASLDVAGYNYEIARFSEDHARLPTRVMYCSESYPIDAFKSWQAVLTQPAVVGDFVWTAIDYLGEAGIGRAYPAGQTPHKHWEKEHFPWRGAACGDLDLVGKRKPISHHRQIVWDRGATLYAWVVDPEGEPWGLTPWSVEPSRASWTWGVAPGEPVTVRVASRWPSVRLLVNGEAIGEAKTGEKEEFLATFVTPYQPGELVAVGLDESATERERFSLVTAGAASQLRLATKSDRVPADRQTIVYLDVTISDADGGLQPLADRRVTFSVEGTAEIIGVGNADPTCGDSYAGESIQTYQGCAQVIIRSTGKAGAATVLATAEGLPAASIPVQFIPKTSF